MLRGIDIADYQGTIDWSAVKAAGIDFAIAKATQGTGNVQATFAANRAGAKAAGVGPFGAYHFAQNGDPVAQAVHFCDVVGALGPDEFAVLDIEPHPTYFTLDLGAWPAFITAWTEVVARLGGPIVVYMSESPAKSMPSSVARWPLWVAGYVDYVPTEWVDWQVGPWTSPLAWQYTDKGTVAGIGALVDMNVAPDDLRARIGLTGVPSVPWVDLVDGLAHQHPTFARRVSDLCRATGCAVYSGARSTEEQAALYAAYLAGTGNPANPPGKSWHEFGVSLVGGPYASAVDLDGDLTAAHTRAAEFSLVFPLALEPWHVQPQEITETARVAGAQDRIPTQEEDPHMLTFRYIAEGVDWVFDGPSHLFFHTDDTVQITEVLDRLGVPALGEVSPATHRRYKAIAESAGYAG